MIATLGGLGFALGTGEVIFRVWRPQNLSGSWRQQHSSGLSLNRAGGEARHQLGDRVVRYRFNSLHQRGPEIPPGSETVLCLGDSFTFGWMLAEEHTFVARLNSLCSEQLPASRWYFANAGAGGWGLADYTAYLELFGPTIRPRKVVCFFNFDDLNRTLRSPLFVLKESKGVVIVQPNLQPARVPLMHRLKQIIPGYQFLLEHSHLLQAVRNRVVFGSVSTPSLSGADESVAESTRQAAQRRELDRGIALGEGLFGRLHAWCSAHQAELIVVTTGWNLDLARTSVEWKFLDHAEPFFTGLGVPFFDIGKVLASQQIQLGKISIPGDGHPNEEGAKHIAIESWAFLKPLLLRPEPSVPSSTQ